MVLVVVLVFEAARKEKNVSRKKRDGKIRSQSRQETMGLRAQREWLV